MYLLTLLNLITVISTANLRYYDKNIVVPLSTLEQFVIDQTGARVKFACVNWPSHLENMIPEGLSSVSMDKLGAFIVSMGFNCVRYPYAVEMIENFDVPISSRINTWMSLESRLGLFHNNPTYSDNTTLLQVFKDAMEMMKRKGLMVILDNHVSKATWCCGAFDGNRWWGGQWFDVDKWLTSLSTVALLAKTQNWSHVVGLGLRNEVFSLKRDSDDEWFKYMRQGMHVVHNANSDLLVVVGGQNFASKFRQILSKGPLVDNSFPESMKSKLVYEAHYYNEIYVSYWWNKVGGKLTCFGMKMFLNSNIGFLTKPGKSYTGPVWVSEFGLNVTGFVENGKKPDNLWFDCLLDWLSEHDLDFGYWELNGQYYYRKTSDTDEPKNYDVQEHWGLLCNDHSCTRNIDMLLKLQTLMRVKEGPGISSTLVFQK